MALGTFGSWKMFGKMLLFCAFCISAGYLIGIEWKLLNTEDDFVIAISILLIIATFGASILIGVKILKKIFGVVAVLALAMLFMFNTGCSRIGPGNVGIKVNMSGSGRGVEDYPARTGWVFYNPISSSIFEYPTYMQIAKWTKDVNEGNPLNEEITFTTGDQMQVAADISLGYYLRAEKVPHFYVKFRNDDIGGFTHGYLRNMARDKFDTIAGKYKIEQIMGDNAQFLAEVRSALQKEVESIGIKIDQFGFIGAPRPPQIVIAAINAKVEATQKAIQIENELRQSTAEAAKQVARAEGEAKAAIARAEGNARANQLMSASLTPNVIEWQRLQIQQMAVARWNGVRPTVEGASSGLLLQLNK